MSKFKEDMDVIVIGENNEIRRGKIQNAIESLKIAIVAYEDGEVAKVPFSRMGIGTISKNPEEPREETEGDKKARFRKADMIIAVYKLLDPVRMAERFDDEIENCFVKSIVILGVTVQIISEIFKRDDVIEINKEDFTNLLINECAPSKISSMVGVSAIAGLTALSISTLTFIVLKDLIPYFFGESKND